MSEPSSCPLCAALADPQKHWGPRQVWTFPHSVAVLGPWQYYTGYCLLVSREHVTELSQLGPRRTPFLEEMALLAEAIEACFQPRKLNYELLGNQVPHLHWHLFPRYIDDPQSRQPVWLALNQAESDPTQRQRLEAGFLPPAESVARLQQWLREHGAPRGEESERGEERDSAADGGAERSAAERSAAAAPKQGEASGEPAP